MTRCLMVIIMVVASFGKAYGEVATNSAPEGSGSVLMEVLGQLYNDRKTESQKEEMALRAQSRTGIPLLYSKEKGKHSGSTYVFPLGSHEYDEQTGEDTYFALPFLSGKSSESEEGRDSFLFYSFPLLTLYYNLSAPEGNAGIFVNLPLCSAYGRIHAQVTNYNMKADADIFFCPAWFRSDGEWKYDMEGVTHKESYSTRGCPALLSGWAAFRSEASNGISGEGSSLIFGGIFDRGSYVIMNSTNTVSRLSRTSFFMIGSYENSLGGCIEGRLPSISPLYTTLSRDAREHKNTLCVGLKGSFLGATQDVSRVDEETDKVSMLGRIFQYQSIGSDRSVLEINPLFARSVDPNSSSFTIAPLLTRVTTSNGQTSVSFDPYKLWPVLYRDESRENLEYLWPIGRVASKGGTYMNSLFPLFDYKSQTSTNEMDRQRHFGMLFGLLVDDKVEGKDFRDTSALGRILFHHKRSEDKLETSVGWSLLYDDEIKGDAYRNTTSMWGLLFRRERENNRVETSAGWTLLYKKVSDPEKKEHSVSVTPLFKYENLAGERAFRIFHFIRIPLGSDNPTAVTEIGN